jgi:Fe-S-cluster containining protein
MNDAPDTTCRRGCGACCIAPSISSAIPGMPEGKPAGMPCVQLMDDYRCALFGDPRRPEVCSRLRPHPAMCGTDRFAALAMLSSLEMATSPLIEVKIDLTAI